MSRRPDPLARTLQAGVLAWILPGAGHMFLGHRALGYIFFFAITIPFLTGVAVGGVKESINPRSNVWLFLAELGCGGYTTAGFFVSNALPTVGPNDYSPYVSYYPESDIAQIYLATAGLLNVLAVLDALARAQYNGLPVFQREMAPDAPPGGSAS